MTLPSNVHVSSHPCLQAKLSQLRSQSTSPRETRDLVHEIASILGVEAFASGLKLKSTGKVQSLLHPKTLISKKINKNKQDKTPLGVEYETQVIDPADLALVPILRSGLGMVEGPSTIPTSAPRTRHITTYTQIELTQNPSPKLPPPHRRPNLPPRPLP